MPNLLPYLAASLVGAMASAILASIGLEALGLGPVDSPTLGMTIYWVIYYAALLHGYWWWWLPPIAIITICSLDYSIWRADEIANPRLANLGLDTVRGAHGGEYFALSPAPR